MIPRKSSDENPSLSEKHYSLPRTIETAWDLRPLTAKEGRSPAMLEFFPSPTVPLRPAPAPIIADFTFSPSAPDTGLTISFPGSAMGGTQPYVYKWSFGDGLRSTGQ